MFDFVHGPSGALHFDTAADSAPSCSGFPPVPNPTNHRTRILPSEVRPPAREGSAVTSAPVGRGVDDDADDDGDVVGDVHALTMARPAMTSAIRLCQSFRCITSVFLLPRLGRFRIIRSRCAAFSGITPRSNRAR